MVISVCSQHHSLTLFILPNINILIFLSLFILQLHLFNSPMLLIALFIWIFCYRYLTFFRNQCLKKTYTELWNFGFSFSAIIINLWCSTMDNDVSIMYLPSIKKCIDRNNLHVALSPLYNRRRLTDEYEQTIDEVWNMRLRQNGSLWNGTKFRIASVTEDHDVDSVTFNLGVTSYKDFIGTNWSPNAYLYQQLGTRDYSNTQVMAIKLLQLLHGSFKQQHDSYTFWCMILYGLLCEVIKDCYTTTYFESIWNDFLKINTCTIFKTLAHCTLNSLFITEL